MKNRRLKKSVIYVLYALSFVTVIGTIYILELVSSINILEDNTNYVNEVILDNTYPVVSTKNIITRPYISDDIKMARRFYSSKDSEEEQQNSLIYYQNTYIPNSGVDYKGNDKFDVVSILDGKVTKVVDNNLLGKIVEITHSNNLISVYQSMGEVMVVEGEDVLQGQVIGSTGEANISTELGNHLHFEIIYNGENVNPEEYYDKELEDL